MLNPIETIFSIHKGNVARLRIRDFQKLLDISAGPQGEKGANRVALLVGWIQEAWNQITEVHV